MNLFLDIETSGLVPKDKKDWRKDYQYYPHVVSIAWKIEDILHHYIIRDTTYTIPMEATKIHGIDTAMMYRSRHNPLEVFDLLAKDLDVAEKVVGHNLYFDSSILKANALRYFGESMLAKEIDAGIHKDKRICTMKVGQKLTGKWPTLQELHIRLFGKHYLNPHSADTDVEAMEKCFKELKRLKLI